MWTQQQLAEVLAGRPVASLDRRTLEQALGGGRELRKLSKAELVERAGGLTVGAVPVQVEQADPSPVFNKLLSQFDWLLSPEGGGGLRCKADAQQALELLARLAMGGYRQEKVLRNGQVVGYLERSPQVALRAVATIAELQDPRAQWGDQRPVNFVVNVQCAGEAAENVSPDGQWKFSSRDGSGPKWERIEQPALEPEPVEDYDYDTYWPE